MTKILRIQATNEQFAEFERRCAVTEAMFARTLCQRFQIPATDEHLQLVAGWLSSARSMGIVNQIDCGIRVDFQQECIPNRRWRWNTVSHLSCDPTDDLDALHRFAAGLGLKRAWFQPRDGIMPHYDLSPGMRQQALRAGANELTTREAVVELIRAWRASAAQPPAREVRRPSQPDHPMGIQPLRLHASAAPARPSEGRMSVTQAAPSGWDH